MDDDRNDHLGSLNALKLEGVEFHLDKDPVVIQFRVAGDLSQLAQASNAEYRNRQFHWLLDVRMQYGDRSRSFGYHASAFLMNGEWRARLKRFTYTGDEPIEYRDLPGQPEVDGQTLSIRLRADWLEDIGSGGKWYVNTSWELPNEEGSDGVVVDSTTFREVGE